MIRKPIFLFLIILFTHCISDRKTKTPLLVKFSLHRFEKMFYDTSIPLDSIKKKYPFFLSKTTGDSIWEAKRINPLEIHIFSSINRIFKDDDYLIQSIAPVIEKVKELKPHIRITDIYTINSDFDFDYRIIINDTLILIGLDNYLGSDNVLYKEFPNYLSKRFDKKYLSADISEAFAKLIVPQLKGDETFAEKLVYYGKIEWIKLFLSNDKDESNILRYDKEEINWCKENEFIIWNYFVQNDLLFSKSSSLDYRFLNPSPFSKFYLGEFDNKTPGEIGKWIGLRIVEKYTKSNSSMPIQKIIDQTDLIEIFNHSKYKPHIN